MATIDDLKAAVERNTTVGGSVQTLVSQIVQMLRDAQNQPDVSAALDEVITQLDTETAQFQDLVTANTPADGQPTP